MPALSDYRDIPSGGLGLERINNFFYGPLWVGICRVYFYRQIKQLINQEIAIKIEQQQPCFKIWCYSDNTTALSLLAFSLEDPETQ